LQRFSVAPFTVRRVCGGYVRPVFGRGGGTETTATAEPAPLFPATKLTKAPWREQGLARIAEQRFVLACIQGDPAGRTIPAGALETIEAHWEAAAGAATTPSKRGASVARVSSHLDAVDTSLLRLAPASYVYGQLPGLLTRMRRFVARDDVRCRRIEQILEAPEPAEISDFDRDLVVAAHHAAAVETRREVTRLRSFKRLLLGTAAVMFVAAVGLAAYSAWKPRMIPICFNPDKTIVCPTKTQPVSHTPHRLISATDVDRSMRSTAGRWDLAIVELVGLIAAALAAATSLRKIRGTSTPYSLPTALALLKLPTGALTAVLGLILMRGEFVPGLSALDTSGQIIAWAVLLGYSQQLLTRFVDQRAQTVLENFGRTREEKHKANAAVDPRPATA
jgi:hypothetical protein